jgi:AraC-like DNA-binding protein
MLLLVERQQSLERELEHVLRGLSSTDDNRPRYVRDLMRYVHAHLFDTGLNVAVARSECGLRDNNVSSLFRREVGCSIKDYIDRLRMDAARRLLQQRRFSVFEIGQSIGYTHPQTFYRVYRRYFGAPPASDRRPTPAVLDDAVLDMPRERTA